MNTSFVLVLLILLQKRHVATYDGNTRDSGNAPEAKSVWEKRLETMISEQIKDLRKELLGLKNVVEDQGKLIQGQKILIAKLSKNCVDDRTSTQEDELLKGTKPDQSSMKDNHTAHIRDQYTKRQIHSHGALENDTEVNEKYERNVQRVNHSEFTRNENYSLNNARSYGRSFRQKRQSMEPVAFSSYLDHELTNIALGTTIICNQILINDGDGYNSNTGMFTAHTPGVFFFSFSIDSQKHHANVRLVLDGTNAVDAVAQVNTMGSNSAIVRLERGQSVWMQTHQTGDIEFISTSVFHMVTFSGFLIY